MKKISQHLFEHQGLQPFKKAKYYAKVWDKGRFLNITTIHFGVVAIKYIDLVVQYKDMCSWILFTLTKKHFNRIVHESKKSQVRLGGMVSCMTVFYKFTLGIYGVNASSMEMEWSVFMALGLAFNKLIHYLLDFGDSNHIVLPNCRKAYGVVCINDISQTAA